VTKTKTRTNTKLTNPAATASSASEMACNNSNFPRRTACVVVRTITITATALLAVSLTNALVVVRPIPSSHGRIAGRFCFVHHNNNAIAPRPPNAMVLRSMTPGNNEDESGGDSDSDSSSTSEQDQQEKQELSLLDKFNNFLDTPILDANNRSDEGAVAEVLKEFVRDEPEIAQVTFSVAVVAILVLVTRLAMSM